MQHLKEQAIDWIRPESLPDRVELDRWHSAVGPPVFATPPRPHSSYWTERIGHLTVLVWNTNVGSGDILGFVADLRGGRFTDGGDPGHIVLLLQEVHRSGSSVPDRPPTSSNGASRIHGIPPRGQRMAIDEVADRLGLDLFYAPSMRNGHSAERGPAEDRGNAILSTLPLSMLRALELPFERQRRVALSARVAVTTNGGRTLDLEFVNVHLDPRSKARRLHRSLGAGRRHQTKWLLSVLERRTPTIVAGDFNTWVRGGSESSVTFMRSSFPHPTPATQVGTLRLSRFLPSLRLDHVFVDVPWSSEHRTLEHEYGSDHRPILVRVYCEKTQ